MQIIMGNDLDRQNTFALLRQQIIALGYTHFFRAPSRDISQRLLELETFLRLYTLEIV